MNRSATVLLIGLALTYLVEANTIKNITQVEKDADRNKKVEDGIKREIRKYMRECGADVSLEDEEDDDNSQDETTAERYSNGNKNNKGTYPRFYGNSGGRRKDYNDDDEDADDGNKKNQRRKYRQIDPALYGGVSDFNFEHYRNNNNNNRYGGNGRRKFYEYDYEDEDDGCGNHNNNRRNNNNRRRNNNNRNRGGYGYSNNQNRGYNGNNFNNHYGLEDPFSSNRDFEIYTGWGGNRGYIYGGRLMLSDYSGSSASSSDLSIIKRDVNSDESNANEEDDSQCLSQCVFGYLEMLDDNRVPSESEVLKFFQTNLQNGAKRIKAVRETRRCFAKLASFDNEDGCAFSKSLSQCLKLNIENN